MAEEIRPLLTIKEFSLKYGLNSHTVRDKIRKGKLVAVKKPGAGRTAVILIIDPGWDDVQVFEKTVNRLVDDHYILQGKVVAALLGVSPRMVRYMAQRGKMSFRKATNKSKRRYSIAEVRRMMALRENPTERKPTKEHMDNAVLRWAMKRLGLKKLPGSQVAETSPNALSTSAQTAAIPPSLNR